MDELGLISAALVVGFIVSGFLMMGVFWFLTVIRERNQKRMREQHREELRAERPREFTVASAWDRIPDSCPWREEASAKFRDGAA